MNRFFFRTCNCFAVVYVLSAIFCASADAVQSTTALKGAAKTPALEEAVKRVLQEHPEFILNVLHENSEAVLEIAQQGNMLRKRKSLLAQWELDAKTPKRINPATGFAKGSKHAPVTIYAFSDFICPFCRQAEEELSQLLLKYPGRIRFVFKPCPSDYGPSYLSSRYAAAAFFLDEAKGWHYYQALFNQPEELEKGGEQFLKTLAEQQGYDLKKFQTELASKKINDLLAAVQDEAKHLNIKGTPYFFINNLAVRGAVSKELFDEAIQKALALEKK